MLVIFFTYWAGMFLQGAESNVSVDIDILQWVVVVPNAMFVVVIVVIALRGSTAKAQRDGEESSPVPDSYSGRDSLSRQVSRIRREGSMAGRTLKLIQKNSEVEENVKGFRNPTSISAGFLVGRQTRGRKKENAQHRCAKKNSNPGQDDSCRRAMYSGSRVSG